MGNGLGYPTAYGRTYCRTCRKWGHPTRKTARQAAHTLHPGHHLTIYPCPVSPGLYHYGPKPT